MIQLRDKVFDSHVGLHGAEWPVNARLGGIAALNPRGNLEAFVSRRGAGT